MESADAILNHAARSTQEREAGQATLFGDAMAARVGTERQVLDHSGLRGIVIRPGLVFGHGGSYDIPTLIRRARAATVIP